MESFAFSGKEDSTRVNQEGLKKLQNPKVLHINTELTWRGGERQMSLLVHGLKERGIQSYLACQKGSVFLQRHHKDFPAVIVSFRGLSLLAALLSLRAFCRREGIHMVDAHSGRAHGIALLLKCLLPSLKVVIHRRVDNKPKANFLSKIKYRSSLINRYIPISDAISQVLKDYGVPEKRLTRVYSAVPKHKNLDKTACRQKLCQQLGWQEARPIIANIAYLTEQKGHETLIRALYQAKKSGALFYAFIAGDGPLKEACERLASSLQLDGDLCFLGVRKDPLELIAASDILAMPSNNEGLGTTVLDALSGKLAVAATRVGGIPEMITHGYNGFLCDVGDDLTHGAHLSTLVKEEPLRKRFGEQGYKDVEDKFSVAAMVEGNLRVYRELALL